MDPEQAVEAAPTLTAGEIETSRRMAVSYLPREHWARQAIEAMVPMALRCSERESRLREVEAALRELVRIRDGEVQNCEAYLRAGKSDDEVAAIDIALAVQAGVAWESARRLLNPKDA